MARKRKRVPDVLWRLFGDRAQPLADAIIALIHAPDADAGGCFCERRGCLYCSGSNAMSYLVRPSDTAEYRKLLTKCFLVVSEDAPPVPGLHTCCTRWSQREVVRRSIEKILATEPSSRNLICRNYDKCTGGTSEFSQLTSSEWDVLLQRVGDVLMTHLLMHASFFLPLPRKNYHQISGFPISDLNIKNFSCFPLSTVQKHSLVRHGSRKRKRSRGAQPLPGEQIDSSNSEAGSMSLALVCYDGSDIICNDDLSSKNCEASSEKKKMLTKKHTRLYRWQRRRKCRSLRDSSGLISCNETCNGNNISPGHQNAICSISNQCEKKDSPCLHCSVFHDLRRISRNSEIDRRNIFYKSGNSTTMLPKNHILYTLKPNASGASHLFRNIFGTDIGSLTTEICSHCSSDSYRDGPTRCLYHSLMKLFKCLIRRARNCPYLRLLNRHCLAEFSAENTRIGASTKLKETGAVNLSRIGSEALHFKGVGNDSELKSKIPIDRAELNKFCCPKKQVVSFVWAVCRRVVPLPLLGDEVSNWRILTKNISKFIELRKFEKFSLKECIHRLKTSKFRLFSNYMNNAQSRGELGYRDTVRHAIMERWIFWLFSHLVSPLIQANFYVTDSGDEKLDVLYYVKSIWEKLIDEGECMKSERFYKLSHTSASKILQNRMFGFSRVRICPKRVGFRMFTNLKAPSRLPLGQCSKFCARRKLRRKEFSNFFAESCCSRGRNHPVKYRYFKPVNRVLGDIHVVLKGLSRTDSFTTGSSVFDYNGVYRKLVPFLLFLRERPDTLPFIVVSDVSKAYDSIDHQKLLRVVEDVVLDDEYALEEVAKVVCSKRRLKVQPLRVMAARRDVANASSGKSPLLPTSQTSDAVFITKRTSRTMRREEAIFNIKEHITRNVVLFRDSFYLQRVGIPQGGILSPLLCSFYYDHMERNVFSPLMEKAGRGAMQSSPGGSKYVLLRFVDDFLFISNSKKQASTFLTRLGRGVRDYNCYMNAEKSGLNFTMEEDGREVSRSSRAHVGKDGVSFLRWSGLLVNCATLEIQADYRRYVSSHLSSTLTVGCRGKVAEQLTTKLKAFLRPKCHPIFYDSNVNSSRVVRLNIYQAFLVSAMKFTCYLSRLSVLPKLNPRLCMNAIDASLRYMNRLIRRKMMHCFRTEEGGVRPKYDVKRREVTWLGLYAFMRVIGRKQCEHGELLGFLKWRLKGYRDGAADLPWELLRYAVDDSHSSLLWSIRY